MKKIEFYKHNLNPQYVKYVSKVFKKFGYSLEESTKNAEILIDFETKLAKENIVLLRNLYTAFANLEIGREVVLYARKIDHCL